MVSRQRHDYLRYAVLYLGLSFSAFLFFLVCYIAARKLHPSVIVYNHGLVTLTISTSIFFFFVKSRFELRIPAFFTSLLLGYAFVVTFPSLLDRSVSLYVIASVAEKESASLLEINDAFIRGYVDGTTAVEKRLNEQLALGNVTHHGDEYSLTPQGKFLYQLNLFLAKLFSIQEKYLHIPTIIAKP